MPHRPIRPDEWGWRSLPLDPNPAAIYALGLTYASHARETGEAPQRIVFEKRCVPTQGQTRITAPDEAALHAAIAPLDGRLADWLAAKGLLANPLLDYEVELGVILLDEISAAELRGDDGAPAPRVGFFLANDVTARAVQICGEGAPDRLAFWSASKSFPGFLPVSARYFTRETPSANDLLDTTIETRVCGRLRQSAPTIDLAFTVNELLLHLCEAMQLERLPRHTWVLTGTPSGIALQATQTQRRLLGMLPRRIALRVALSANQRKPAFLKRGDELRCSASIPDLLIESTVY